MTLPDPLPPDLERELKAMARVFLDELDKRTPEEQESLLKKIAAFRAEEHHREAHGLDDEDEEHDADN